MHIVAIFFSLLVIFFSLFIIKGIMINLCFGIIISLIFFDFRLNSESATAKSFLV